MCDEEVEDELHVLFGCTSVRESWHTASLGSIMQCAYQQHNAMDRVFAMCKTEERAIVGQIATLLCRGIKVGLSPKSSMSSFLHNNLGHFVASITQAKAWALLHAMKEARHRGLDH
ncbi:hypothetical protein A2U01_0002314, partial [Trifolium medium]|nr:hypothetical protein [Trifolium medium]